MGKPNGINLPLSLTEYIGDRGKPAELKHLSRWRKRNQNEIPLVAASERGKAQTEAFKSRGCRAS